MTVQILAKLALALAAAMLTALPATAQKKGANLSDTMAAPTPAGQAVETLALAYQLADHARATRDPRAMIVAARMIATAPVVARASGQVDASVPTAQQLFTEAATLAAGDVDLLADIEMARAEQSKGAGCAGSGAGCALSTVYFLQAGLSWKVRIAARGGVPLIIGVRRAEKTSMELRIFDENGNLVCQDLSQKQTLYCRVSPIWSGPFDIAVQNSGDADTRVVMVTN